MQSEAGPAGPPGTGIPEPPSRPAVPGSGRDEPATGTDEPGSEPDRPRVEPGSRSDEAGTPAATRRGRPRNPDAARRIKAAAAELLLERGFERMTVDDVAERARVGKATVYRRWPSKDDLAYDALADLLDVEVPTPDTGSIEGDLTRLYGDLIGFLGTPRGVNFLRLAANESGRDARIGGLYRQAIADRIELSRVSFQRAIERGEIRADIDITVVAERVLGVFVLRALTGAPMPTETGIPGMVRLTLDGIRAR